MKLLTHDTTDILDAREEIIEEKRNAESGTSLLKSEIAHMAVSSKSPFTLPPLKNVKEVPPGIQKELDATSKKMGQMKRVRDAWVQEKNEMANLDSQIQQINNQINAIWQKRGLAIAAVVVLIIIIVFIIS